MELIIVLNILKAFVDKYVSKGKFNTSDRRRWHVWYWVHYVVMATGLGFYLYGLTGELVVFLGFAAAARIVVFNITLNKLRNLDWFYLGKEGVDGWISKRLGGRNSIYYACAFFVLIVTGGSLWF